MTGLGRLAASRVSPQLAGAACSQRSRQAAMRRPCDNRRHRLWVQVLLCGRGHEPSLTMGGSLAS